MFWNILKNFDPTAHYKEKSDYSLKSYHFLKSRQMTILEIFAFVRYLTVWLSRDSYYHLHNIYRF